MQNVLSYTNKIIALLMALIVLLCSSSVANASIPENSSENQIIPMYVNINSNQSSIIISGIKATCYAKLTSKISTTLKIKMECQKKKSSGYVTVQTWTKSKTGNSLALTGSRNINILYDYRLKVTFTAGSETVTTYKYPA